jgi:nucleotide-binding universal stress UspA family protein
LVPALEGQTFATEQAFEVISQADDRLRAKLANSAEAAARKLEDARLTCGVNVIDGDPAHEVVAEADRWKADTIFIGARGLGALDRLVLGSVSTGIVTRAHCSVEVVR